MAPVVTLVGANSADEGQTKPTVTISNVAPANVSTAVTPSTINENDSTTVSGTFTDPGGSCSTTHTYAAAGVYTVIVTVVDDDGGTDTETFPTFIVVYDPSAGFVTGGGWINVTADSCQLATTCAGATGKANLGFNSKYKKGASVPDGQTEFQFQAGNLNFHSKSYQWLVINGFRAQYRGTGEINGATGYSFILTAYDGNANGGGGVDKFRIKIWRTSGGQVVFDSKMGTSDDIDAANPQAIAGGSIVIHK